MRFFTGSLDGKMNTAIECCDRWAGGALGQAESFAPIALRARAGPADDAAQAA